MSKSDTLSTSADANRVPALFSPIMSVIFTFIFTPMFGGFLQGLNWRELGDDELAARKAAYVQPEPNIKTGWLARYARLVTSANLGAVLK